MKYTVDIIELNEKIEEKQNQIKEEIKNIEDMIERDCDIYDWCECLNNLNVEKLTLVRILEAFSDLDKLDLVEKEEL